MTGKMAGHLGECPNTLLGPPFYNNVNPPQARSWWILTCRHHWIHKEVTSLHRVIHDNSHTIRKKNWRCVPRKGISDQQGWLVVLWQKWPSIWTFYSKAIVFVSFWFYEVLNLSPLSHSPSFWRTCKPNYFPSKYFSIKTSQRHFQLPTASEAASCTWDEKVMIIRIEGNHSNFKPRNTLWKFPQCCC